jgi:outer membrane protein OmpA-like peptidoglycan-associated protein
MKKLVFLAICLFCLKTTAQTRVWFNDDFNDNHKHWSVKNTAEVEYSVENGKYILHNKTEQGQYTFVQFFTDPEKDFYLESNITLHEGLSLNGIGLALWGRDNSYFTFLINPIGGNFWVGAYVNKKWTNLIKPENEGFWQASDAIKKGFLQNKLSLTRKDGRISFFINDTEVFTKAYLPTFEKVNTGWFGLVSFNKNRVEAENFIFKQDNQINLLPNMQKGLKKENLGSNVNSGYTDKMPVISADGKTLYFCIDSDPANTDGPKDDIWVSESKDGQNWGQRWRFPKPVNNNDYNYIISVTPDNNTLLVGNVYNADGTMKGKGVSITHRTANGWSMPEELHIKNFYSDASTTEYCLSANRKVLLMSLQRSDSYGEKDLYVSFDLGNNNWSEPKNLGKTVNTYAKDETPFLAADGVSLYYSTSGLPGYGQNDVFVAKRLDDTWTNWSVPQNLGSDINSPAWDAYYTLPASGNYAYMVQEKENSEELDLVRVKLPEVAKPQPVVLIHGKVFNSKTKLPLQAIITYYDLKTHKELGTATSDPKTGDYKIVLPAGFVYSFLAKKQNFYSVTDNIDLLTNAKYQEINRDLFLSPLEVGQTIRLNNIFFPLGEYTLLKESFAELDQVATLMNENPAVEILLEGHTDIIGNPNDNMKLSENRVKAVKEYLVKKGITESRIQTKAYGGTKPIVTKGTDEDRKINRRVEFKILKK